MNAPAPLPTPAWRLRFVGGALRGRRLVLRRGTLRVGGAADCDIVLQGTQVRPHHARLFVGEVALAIERLDDAPLYLNGAECGERRRSLIEGDRLQVGGCEIEVERDSVSDSDNTNDDADFLKAPASQTPAGARVPPRSRLGILFVAGLAVSVGMLWWALGPASAGSFPGPQGVESKVRRMLEGYAEVRVLSTPDGRIQLDGFVESTQRLRSLEQAMAPFDGTVNLRIQVVQTLVERARVFVGDPAIEVHYGGHGRLVLSGATDSEAVAQKIARLGEDLQPAARIDNRVRYRGAPQGAAASEPTPADKPWRELLPARIVSITETSDGMRHIQLANGHRYFEGAQLKSGASLQRITTDEIVVGPGTVP